MKQPTLLFIVLLTISSVAQAQFDYYPGFPKLKNNTNSIHTFQKKTVVLKSDWETRHQVKKIDLQRKNTQITTSYDVLKFDKFGRLTEVSLSDDERDVKRMLYKLSYNKNGDITLFKRYGDERLEYTEELTYNDQYHIIKEKKITPYDTIVSSYKRDETGRLLDMLLTIKRSEITTIVYRNKYFYHNNKLVRIEEYNSDAVLTRVEYFEYNSEETEMEHSLIYPNESDKKEILARCKYDEDGNKRSEITYSENGNITLSFDTKGNIITKKDCNESDCYTEFNKYDENNNLIETRGEDSDYITKYTYDNRNNKIKQVTTENGKITEERSISYNQFDMEIKRTFDNSRLSSKVWENKYEFDEKENWTKAEYPTDNQLFYEVTRTISYWEDNQDEKFQYDLKETYIPYRKGKLWGLADTLGNIVVEPQYDKVFYYNHIYRNGSSNSESYFGIQKDKKVGLMTPNEVIVSPTYFQQKIEKPFIIGYGKDMNRTNYVSVHYMNGELVFDEKLAYFRSKQVGVYTFFLVASLENRADKHTNQLYDLYEYDSRTGQLNLLLEDILDVKKDNSSIDGIYVKIGDKRRWDKYYVIAKNDQLKLSTTLPIKTNNKDVPIEEEQTAMFPPPFENDDVNSAPKEALKKAKKAEYNYVLKKTDKNETLLINNTNSVRSKNKRQHFEIQKLEIYTKSNEEYEYSFRRNDTIYHAPNYVLIKQVSRNKKKIPCLGIITPHRTIVPQFVTVKGFYYSYFKQPFFIVSKLNETTELMEYGVIYADNTWLYPLQSEFEIVNVYDFKYFSFEIRKNGKMGLATKSFDHFIAPKYDTITKWSEYNNNFYHLSIDGKFGIYATENKDKIYEMPVIFNDLFVNPVLFQNNVGAWQMTNDKGEFLGYVLPSGRLFYED